MHLLEIAALDPRAAAELGRLGRRRRRPYEAGKAPLGFGHNRLVLNSAGRGQQHAGAAVIARQIGADALRIERAHCFRRAEDRTAEWLAGKRGFVQTLEHQIVGRVFGRADLLHDDILLAA